MDNRPSAEIAFLLKSVPGLFWDRSLLAPHHQILVWGLAKGQCNFGLRYADLPFLDSFVTLQAMSESYNQLPSYEEMVKAGMHFGRKKSIFNPKMKPFVYALRDSICIIDLVKTRQGLEEAINFLRETIGGGKLVLFVGISEQSADLIKDLAESLSMPYVTNRWLGGSITNFKTIISRVRHLEALENELASGGFAKYVKKEKTMKEKEIVALRKKFDGLRKLTRVPDVIFVASAKDCDLAIKEAKVAKIKTVGLVNTESDPGQLDFPIAANDNARRSVALIISAIKQGLANAKETV